MRYIQRFLLIAALPLFFMGAGSGEAKFTEGIQPGSLAPGIDWQDTQLEENGYVLLQFWAAGDPESRVMNTRMHNVIAQSNAAVRLMSVCMDESASVFEGVVKTDRLDRETQRFDPRGKDSAWYKAYRLEYGLSNWLIDSNGVIVAKNLSPDDLKAFL